MWTSAQAVHIRMRTLLDPWTAAERSRQKPYPCAEDTNSFRLQASDTSPTVLCSPRWPGQLVLSLGSLVFCKLQR